MSTRKNHRLPYIHTIFPNQAATDINSHQVAYGFGYDSVHEDYKLLRIVRFRDTLESEVMVYSLKSNSWKNLLTRFPYDLVCMRSMGLFSNVALHWLINHPVIVAFDVAAEEFREVSLPPDAPCKEYFEVLWVFESRLCVIRNHIVKGAEIWALKHYGVEESWTKLLSISDRQVTSPHCVVPMAYLSNDNELLFLQDNNKFLCYDLKTNKMKNVMIQGMPAMFDVMPYAKSLVKPSPMVNATMGKHKSKKNAVKRDDFLSKGFKLVL